MVIAKPVDGAADPFAHQERQGAISYREAGELVFQCVRSSHAVAALVAAPNKRV